MSAPAPGLPPGWRLRPPEPRDATSVIALIDTCYRLHGDRVYTEGYDADLLDLPGQYLARGHPFVLLEDEPSGRILGTHAVVPLADRPGVATFRRLYVDPGSWGTGAGELLMRWAFAESRRLGIRRVEFWSDVRFRRAHAFFARFGFESDGRTRSGDDGAMPYVERFFATDLPAIGPRHAPGFLSGRFPCPHLPPGDEGLDWRSLHELRDAEGDALYRTALSYAQSLWLRGYTARAILALDRALYADLGAATAVLGEPGHAPPYAALGWLVRRHPGDTFLGNPRVSFQHLADRVRGHRAAIKSARAWACWHVVRVARPSLEGDPAHRVEPPSREEVGNRLAGLGWPGERDIWLSALEGAGR